MIEKQHSRSNITGKCIKIATFMSHNKIKFTSSRMSWMNASKQHVRYQLPTSQYAKKHVSYFLLLSLFLNFFLNFKIQKTLYFQQAGNKKKIILKTRVKWLIFFLSKWYTFGWLALLVLGLVCWHCRPGKGKEGNKDHITLYNTESHSTTIIETYWYEWSI